MGLLKIGGLLKRVAVSRSSASVGTILSTDQFRAAMARQRAASDRHGHAFSVVVFGLGKTEDLASQLDKLIALLSKRKRLTDEVGWFAKETVAALLPFTAADGAWAMFHDVRQRLVGQGVSVNCQVFTYPSDEHPTRDPQRREELATQRPGTGNGDGNVDGNGNGRARPGRKPADGRVDVGEPSEAITPINGHSGADVRRPARPTAISSDVRPMEPLFARPLPAWKRALDIVGALLALVVFSPVMAITAVAIKLTSQGPVIFCQQRSGWRAEPFTFCKFRSMYVGAEAKKRELMAHNLRTGPVFKMENDPRITPVGRFIRKWSIDELPQLLNVLMGDMSLVGPRPPTLDEVDKYQQWQDRRLEITPGLTCLWQVYARHDKCFDHWVRLDIEYAQRRSFLFDMKILAMTIPAVLSRRGAC